MIESLHIEDLGVIEEADLPLSRGLTALTGETGAGKTMVLTSLGLCWGSGPRPPSCAAVPSAAWSRVRSWSPGVACRRPRRRGRG